MDKSKTWGGNRPGAGRPPSKEKKIKVDFSLRPDTVKKLDALARRLKLSRSGALEAVLEQALELESLHRLF